MVIRVNRMPPRGVNDRHAQIGRRTDIYFVDRCFVDSAFFGYNLVGGGQDECNTNVVGDCPFRAIVLKGNTRTYEYMCAGETHNNDKLRHEAGGSVIPYGIVRDEITDAVLELRGFEPEHENVPTTGFHAAIAMGLECHSLRLYGFAGSTTLDGHHMDASHDIETEHALLRQLTSHTLRDDQLVYDATMLRSAWQVANVSVVC